MAIPFKCPTCGATGKAGSKLIGSVMPCPKCGSLVQIDEVFPAAPPDLTPPVPIEDPEQAWGRSTAKLPPAKPKPRVRVVPSMSTLRTRPLALIAFSIVSLTVGAAMGMTRPGDSIASAVMLLGFFGLVAGVVWLTKLQDALAPPPPPSRPLSDREIMLAILEQQQLAANRLGCLLWIVGVAFALSVIGALMTSSRPY